MKKLIPILVATLLLPSASSAQHHLIGPILTNPYRDDGFGGHYQTIIYAAVYAELHGKIFRYTPIQNIAHNYDGDPDYIAKKEALIKFIGNFPLNTDPTLQPKMHRGEQFIFFENNLNACIHSKVFKKIKSIFRADQTKKDYFDNDNLNIAIHIRRPNPDDNRIQGTDVPDCVYVKIIHSLRNLYSSENPLFHIHSQGSIDSFGAFKSIDAILHLNETIEETFPAMVFADILVTAPSSFSYVAGLLSEGIVYYLPSHGPDLPELITLHPHLPHWTQLNLENR